METVVVTLRLPTDLYSLVRKYAKAFIINEQFSNSSSIKNTSVLNTAILENQSKPSLDDVVVEAKRINSNVNPQRFFSYYQERNWLDKNGKPFDWKAMLAKWGTYNLEKAPSRNDKVKSDFSNDQSFKNSVAALLAEGKAS